MQVLSGFRIGLLLWIIVLIFSGTMLQSRYFLPVEDLGDSSLSYKDKLEEFGYNYPNIDYIDRYLKNKTFIVSNPPIGNIVYFFDSNGKIYEWQGVGVTVGSWSFNAKLLPVRLGYGFTLKKVYVVCRDFHDGGISQIDNCNILRSLRSILPNDAEIKDGDFLRLAYEGSNLGALPSGPITATQLRSQIAQKEGMKNEQ